MSQLHHPNLLPLLSHTTVDNYNNGRLLQLVYMLFPVCEVMPCLICSSLRVACASLCGVCHAEFSARQVCNVRSLAQVVKKAVHRKVPC